MQTFDFEIKHLPNATEIFLIGPLTEVSDFSKVHLPPEIPVIVNFAKLTGINSFGLRLWLRWINEVSKHHLITFRNCLNSVVRQANILGSFFPERAIVESFFVAYVCDSCEYEKNVLYRYKLEYGAGWIKHPQNIPCTDPSHGFLRIDVPENYFRFLDRQFKDEI